jgi:hypothetical protein
MDFWGTLNIYFRRWYFSVPALVLCLATTAAIYMMVPTRYVSNVVLVLTTSPNGGTQSDDPKQKGTLTNPLLNPDKGLSMSAAILIQTLSSPEVGLKVGVTPGGSTTYTVGNGSSNPELLDNGPFVFIQVDSASPQEAQKVALALTTEAGTELAAKQRQLDAPLQTYVAAREVVPATTPVPEGKSRSRAAAAALALGLVASLVAAFGGESLAQARRARRMAEGRKVPRRSGGPKPEPKPDVVQTQDMARR